MPQLRPGTTKINKYFLKRKKKQLTLIKHLLCAKFCCKCFACLNSFHPQNALEKFYC